MHATYRTVAGIVAVVAGAAIAMVTSAGPRGLATDGPARSALTEGSFSTSRQDLERLEQELDARLAASPGAGALAAQLAEVLLRRARVEANGGYTAKAARALSEVLRREPDDYNALRALGAVRLSQHRFRQAIDVAQRASRIRPKDAWNFGVLGDAYLELGEYDQAFDAFDTMVRLRPDAAAYARIAYAHELQGRLPDALRAMRMATEATSAGDAESLAWHHAQTGLLHLQLDQLVEAEREFSHAEFVFPEYPYARLGRARLAVVRGDLVEGLREYRAILENTPNADEALSAAELLSRLGRTAEADTMFGRAEALERDAWRTELEQPANLARILAERGVRTEEAVTLAETAAASRKDIFTMDALAWSYYRAGRLGEARKASLEARRTGTRDPRVVAHAETIDAAAGEF